MGCANQNGPKMPTTTMLAILAGAAKATLRQTGATKKFVSSNLIIESTYKIYKKHTSQVGTSQSRIR